MHLISNNGNLSLTLKKIDTLMCLYYLFIHSTDLRTSRERETIIFMINTEINVTRYHSRFFFLLLLLSKYPLLAVK